MKSNRPPTRPASFNDTQFVEVVGPSVHTPGERAKPRPADRPREVLPLDNHSTQLVDTDDSVERRSSHAD